VTLIARRQNSLRRITAFNCSVQ